MKKINLTGAASIVSSIANTALVLVDTGNGLRTRLSPQLLEEIGNPEKVEVLCVDDSIVILPAREGNKALDTTDTEDLVGKKVELEVKNNTSKKTGLEFSNIRKVRLIDN